MAKAINPSSKCYVDVYTQAEVDALFANWEGISSESIPANSNLNNYRTLGFYKCPLITTAQTIANVPTTDAFCMIVEEHAGVKQTLTRYQTTLPTTWVRNYYNGAWGAWTRVNNTVEDPQIFYGTSNPSSSLGKNGDIYFMY